MNPGLWPHKPMGIPCCFVSGRPHGNLLLSLSPFPRRDTEVTGMARLSRPPSLHRHPVPVHTVGAECLSSGRLRVHSSPAAANPRSRQICERHGDPARVAPSSCPGETCFGAESQGCQLSLAPRGRSRGPWLRTPSPRRALHTVGPAWNRISHGAGVSAAGRPALKPQPLLLSPGENYVAALQPPPPGPVPGEGVGTQ